MKVPLSNSMAAIALSTAADCDEAPDSNSGNTELQQEMLLERIRTKAHSLRTLSDSVKSLRMCILKKQHLMDGTDRGSLGSCLDKLQQHIPVSSLEAMLERLQATAKQLNLKFTSSAKYEVYISCDMFYVEVLLNRDGTTQDVRVEFAGESSSENVEQSSPELLDCLSRCDFREFSSHLEGFLSMYTLSIDDKKAKLRTQYALKALETDLSILFELAQETISDTYKLVLKCPVGLLVPRKGGHSMRLIYFISPYELLDTKEGTVVPLDAISLSKKTFGRYVELRIEATTELHKLQLATLMQITKSVDGKKLPSFPGLNASNSITIPSVFSLKLPEPLPLSLSLARRIADITGITLKDVTGTEVPDLCQPYPPNTTFRQLVELIVYQASDHKRENCSRGLTVTLPDEQHCYFMSTQGCDFPGMFVSAIPFTHPTHIASILMVLRQQAAFNELIGSCVRPNSKQDMDACYMFEVTSLSHEYLSVTFEHPADETTATAEIDLTDLCSIKCRLHTLMPSDSSAPAFCSDEYATNVLQRCFSIPITMRAVMRKVTKDIKKPVLSQGDFPLHNDSSNNDSGQNNKYFSRDYERKNGSRGNSQSATNSSGININKSASNGLHAAINSLSSSEINSQQTASALLTNNLPPPPPYTPVQVKTEPLTNDNGKVQQLSKQSFLEDVKSVKVRKRKPGTQCYNEDIIEIDDPMKDPLDISDIKPFSDHDGRKKYSSLSSNKPSEKIRKDHKNDKFHNFVNKKRAPMNSFESSKSLPANKNSLSKNSSVAATATDLAALREQIYGAGSAAKYSQLMVPANPSPPMKPETKDSNSSKESSRKSSSTGNLLAKKSKSDSDNMRRSPIVLDLTDTVDSIGTSSKKSSSKSSGSTMGVSSLSQKRPGVDIFPLSGSSTAIPIPSSITVTAVPKTSLSSSSSYSSSYSMDDKYKDKKDRKDKKESSSSSSSSDRKEKDKKRRREDSPSSKSSKVQIISSKHSSDKYAKVEKNLNSLSSKPGTPPYTSSKKSVPTSPKSLHKVSSYSPTHKSSSSSSSYASKSSHSSTSSSYHSSSSSPKSSPKHPSSGKPSLNSIKSCSSSVSFTKPSLSPKLSNSSSSSSKSSLVSSSSSSNSSSSHSTKDREGSRSSTSSPSRPSSSSSSSSSSKSKSSSGYGSSNSTSSNSSSHTSSSSDKITKTESSSSSSPSKSSSSLNSSDSSSTAPNTTSSGSFFQSGNIQVASAIPEKSSSLLDRAKASPPKYRKGSSLIDIVDKLRAGVSGGLDSILQQQPSENSDKKEAIKTGGVTEPKKDPDKNYTIKPLDGLKLSINKAKMKEMKETAAKLALNSTDSPNPKVLKSGLKPGVSSGPASKKVSMSSLPPIPKLTSISNSSIGNISISPLSGSSNSSNQSYNSANSVASSRDSPKESQTPVSSKSTKDRNSSTNNSLGSANKSFGSSGASISIPNSNNSTVRTSDQKDKYSKLPSTNSVNQNHTSPVKTDLSVSRSKSDNSVKSSSFSVSTKTLDSVVPQQLNSMSSSLLAKANSLSVSLAQQCLPPLPPPPILHTASSGGGGGSNYPHPLSPSVSIKIVKSPAPVTSPLNIISPLSQLVDDETLSK